MTVIKKDGTQEAFNPEKIIIAIHKSAERVMIKLTSEDENFVVTKVLEFLGDRPEVSVPELHNQVEAALDQLNPAIAKSYRDYRNYKKDFVHMMDEVYQKSQSIRYIGDKSNANTDSALVSTQRSLIYSELNSELYKKFFLNKEELQAMKDGYIYIHDRSARLDTMNCFRRDTKFITSKGVKSFYDFKDGDTVEVKTHLGNWKKAIVHSYGYQPIQKVVLEYKDKSNEVYCTPNHRWILKSGEETTSLKVGDQLWETSECWEVSKIESLDSNELTEVWCLEVEDDHSFLLDGGIPTGNCCLANMTEILTNGFEMGNGAECFWLKRSNAFKAN